MTDSGHIRPTLHGQGSSHMMHTMLHRLFTRHIIAVIVAVGVVLSGTAPGWAAMPANGSMSDGMSMMPGMATQNDCMGAAEHSRTGKNLPCKNADNNCGMCVTCGIPISGALLSERLSRRSEAVFTQDVNRNGIATLPALPPPIA
jgi:hypothetical protein